MTEDAYDFPDQPWGPATDDPQLLASYALLAETTRDLLAVLSSVRPPNELVHQSEQQLRQVTEQLRPWITTEDRQLAGKGYGIPGRSQLLVPPVVIDESSSEGDAGQPGRGDITGSVLFTRWHLGGHNAVHGGALPLVFDEFLGRVAGAAGRGRSRTAYLHVNYRSVTPLDTQLRIAARMDRLEGRKMFVSGELYDGERLCADAESLFVTLLPGQP